MIGVEIGQYRIEASLGEGGMGTVYRALDTRLNRSVAIKFLSSGVADTNARQRFQREAQMASSLNHPHILTVHDAGEFEGRQYLVTEFVDGGTLKEWAQAEKRTWRDILDLLTGVADGLATAHEARITHRDIKPANILVSRHGYAKLADFGLAKLTEAAHPDSAARTLTEMTRPGMVVGTIAYMSPEQASGKQVDARSDIFSFGVVLYELLAGRRPFAGGSELEELKGIIHGTPAPLDDDVPAQLRTIVEKALEKDPAARYQSMREMTADLRRLARLSEEASAASVRRSAPRRRRTWISVAAAAALVLIAAGYLLPRFRAPAAPASREYRQLTNFAESATQPALSPDGRMMAFVRGPETFIGPGQIYVKFLPDGDAVQLTRDNLLKMAPRFSADGTRIAYSTLGSGSWDTWIVPVLGGQQPRRFLINAEGLVWIRETVKDGRSQPRLLFSESTGKGITMAVVSSTESRSDQRTVYVEDGIMDHFAYLSPDAKQLLLVEMGFNGWQPCRLAPYDGSSKGRKVGPQGGQCTSAAWSPDGKWMYFSADVGSGFHIWRQRFPDGNVEQFTSGTTEEEGIEFAPDGRSFLTSIGTRQSTLWVHNARGDRQVTSEAYAFSPSFSSDGRKLFYLAGGAEGISTIRRGGLWVMDLQTDERQRLLPDYTMEHYSISRDGRRTVFASASDKGHLGVWLATLDGRSAPRQLTRSDGLHAFFGAGDEIFFAAQEKEGTFVYRIKEDGSNLRKAIPNPVYHLYGVSPDGKHIAVWTMGDTEATRNAVMVHPLDGSAPTTICRMCGGRDTGFAPFLSWSPDGKLLFVSLWSIATYAVPLPPGRVLPPLPPGGLRTLEDAAALPGAKPFPVAGAFISPDPAVYAYTKVTAQRNIYRVPVP